MKLCAIRKVYGEKMVGVKFLESLEDGGFVRAVAGFGMAGLKM